MLRRTDLILSKSAAFEGTIPICDNSTKKSCDNYYDTAATLFLKKLETDPAFKTVPLNLIAHSMGSIVANNILARHPNLPFQNVVYMGAATRIKDLETVLVPWMRSDRHQKSNFYNLSLDPYRELGENAYYDFLPRGSLLNWIDFTFGEINSFKDRTAGSWWNIARTAEDVFPNPVEELEINNLEKSLTNLRTRVHLTKFGIGENNGPQAHGDFDDYCFWKRDFWIANETQTHPNCAY